MSLIQLLNFQGKKKNIALRTLFSNDCTEVHELATKDQTVAKVNYYDEVKENQIKIKNGDDEKKSRKKTFDAGFLRFLRNNTSQFGGSFWLGMYV